MLFGLVTLQTLLYAGLLLAFRPLDADLGAWLAVFALLVATGCVAVCMGLAISAFSGTPDQAMSFVPLAVIPQLLFAGAIVPVEGMAEPAQTISYGIFAQWSLAATGTAMDMNARIAESHDPAWRGGVTGRASSTSGLVPGLAVLLGFAPVVPRRCSRSRSESGEGELGEQLGALNVGLVEGVAVAAVEDRERADRLPVRASGTTSIVCGT